MNSNGKVDPQEAPIKPFDDIDFDFDIRPVELCAKQKSRASNKKDVATARDDSLTSYEYKSCVAEFSTSMCYLLEYMHQVGRNSSKSFDTNYAGIYRIFSDMISEARRSKKKTALEVILRFSANNGEAKTEVVIPVVDEDKLRSIIQYTNAAIAAPRILAETMIQEIVNTWEHLLASLIGIRIDSTILKTNTKSKISYEEIDKFKDVSEIRQLFVEKIIREFLRQDIDELISALNTEYKVDFASNFTLLTDLKETIARRHAIVHCNSIATVEYCERLKRLGKETPQIGMSIVTSQRYLLHSWDVFFAAGMMVSHLFQVTHGRHLRSSKMETEADSLLVTESHTALEENRNEAALIMLQYANKRRMQDEWARLATKINLALTYKRKGCSQECQQVLSEHNWELCSDEFRASVAALQGDTQEALTLICKLCRKDKGFLKAAYRWVVFEDVRRDSAFLQEMQKLLSKSGKHLIQVLAPAVHFSKNLDKTAVLHQLYTDAMKYKQLNPQP